MSRSSSSSPLRSPLDARLRQADLHDLFERQRSEEHTSELQSRLHLVCRLLLEKNKLFLVPIEVLLPYLVKNSLHASAPYLGLVFASGGIVSHCPPLCMAQLRKPARDQTLRYS